MKAGKMQSVLNHLKLSLRGSHGYEVPATSTFLPFAYAASGHWPVLSLAIYLSTSSAIHILQSYLIALFYLSAVTGPLAPRTWTVIRLRHTFSVAGLTTWNGLLVALRLMPVGYSALYHSGLKTTLFDQGWAGSAPE